MLDQIKKHIQNNIYRIVFIGDSLTSCEWVHPNWPDIIEYVLKEELTKEIGEWKLASWNIRCINSALDGSTTKDYLTRIDEYVLQYKPNLVFDMIGANDPHALTTKETYDNQTKIIDSIHHAGITTILSTSPASYDEEYNNDYLPFKKSIEDAGKAADIFVDLFSEFKNFPLKRLYTFRSREENVQDGIKIGDIDYVHPNQLGNAYIAKVFLEKVFGISFNPEKFMKETANGVMFPDY